MNNDLLSCPPPENEQPDSPIKKRRSVPLLPFLAILLAVAVLSSFLVWFLVRRQADEEMRLLREEQAAAIEALRAEQQAQTPLFDLKRLLALDRLFAAHSLKGADGDALTEALLDAYVEATGDLYAAHYTSEEYVALLERQNGRFVGIGVSVLSEPTALGLQILSVFKGSPAEKAGLLRGDLIVGVDGVSFEGMSAEDCAALIRGEENTSVTVSVLREGASLSFTMLRQSVAETTVTYKMLDANVAYVQLLRFSEETPVQLQEAVSALKGAGAVAFVFDVRNNPGGLVNAVSECLGYLLPDGPLVRVNYKKQDQTYVMRSEGGLLYRTYGNGARDELKGVCDQSAVLSLPIAVLTNESTASAGEIFAAVMRDYAEMHGVNARLFGTKTFGKGVVQKTYRTGEGDAIKMTVATYDPPYGDNYDGVGVTPNVTVTPMPGYESVLPEQLSPEKDLPLAAAAAWLREQASP